MDRLADKLTGYIISQNFISKDDYDIYKYGMQTSFEMILYMAICSVVAIYIKSFFEFLMVISIFFSLRAFVGGIHLKHFITCLTCSFLVINSILILPKFYIPYKSGSLIFTWICLLSIFLLAPGAIKNSMKDQKEWIYLEKQRKRILIGIAILGLVFWTFNLSKLLSLIFYTTIAVFISMVLEIIKNVKNM
ncbi:MAG: accessory gene regulator B family protein [Anaerocolumna sp.]